MTSMKKELILITAFMIICIGILSGCTTSDKDTSDNGTSDNDDTISDEEKILGTWENDKNGDILIFYSDGTLTDPLGVSNYRCENNLIIFTEEGSNVEKVAKYNFEGDDILIITYISPVNITGSTMNLIRKN